MSVLDDFAPTSDNVDGELPTLGRLFSWLGRVEDGIMRSQFLGYESQVPAGGLDHDVNGLRLLDRGEREQYDFCFGNLHCVGIL